MIPLSLDQLEKRVKKTLTSNPQDTIEVSNISEDYYNKLKEIFNSGYEVKWINYIIHIRKK